MRLIGSSIFMYLYGAFGVGLGILTIVSGFVAGLLGTVTPLYPAALASIGLLVFGALFLVMGILGIVCGFWLWHGQVWGAAIGVFLLIAGIIIGTLVGLAGRNLVSYEFAGTIWLGNGLILVLLLGSWLSLQSQASDFPEL